MERFRYYENRFRSADKVTIIYQIIIIILILLNFSKIRYAVLFLIFHVGVIVFLYRLPGMGSNLLLNFMRLWNPAIFLPLNFFQLPYLVHQINPNDADILLIKADYWLFGVHPTIWIEVYSYPWLTEGLQFIYSIFYYLPVILGILLYRRTRMQEFDYFSLILTYGFYMSYLGYFVLPALGPRYTLDLFQTGPVTGLWFTDAIRISLDTLEKIQRNAFPSGHTMMTALTMYFSAKHHKIYFAVMLFIGTSLIYSTVYLRYHYVIDVIAGLMLAVLVVVTAPAIYRKLS